MFGGVGIYCGDLFFGLIDDDTLYFKVDDSNRSDFTHARWNRSVVRRGWETMGTMRCRPIYSRIRRR